jgi:hypothetical protein
VSLHYFKLVTRRYCTSFVIQHGTTAHRLTYFSLMLVSTFDEWTVVGSAIDTVEMLSTGTGTGSFAVTLIRQFKKQTQLKQIYVFPIQSNPSNGSLRFVRFITFGAGNFIWNRPRPSRSSSLNTSEGLLAASGLASLFSAQSSSESDFAE